MGVFRDEILEAITRFARITMRQVCLRPRESVHAGQDAV